MRVIAGKARRLQLKTVPGMETRPTTDRVKETLFNIIAPGLLDIHFLDLFAGSGGIGIEALSRGAKKAVFVEKDPKAMRCIRENLEHTRLLEQAEMMRMDVVWALSELKHRGEAFAFIFMDPPYGQGLERRVLEFLATSRILEEDGVVIAETRLDADFGYASDLGFSIVREKEYKKNKHVFLKRAMEYK